ncbi:MAG: hypothetical protein RL339_1031 [Pseudomonadota bacterium]|jgi:predicted PurR-regulated permease PerM
MTRSRLPQGLTTGIAVVCAIVVLGIVLVLIAQPFVPALVWALTLAVLCSPFERRLRARTGSPALAASLTLLLAAILVVIPGILVISALINQIVAGAGTYGPLLSPAGLERLGNAYPRVAQFIATLEGGLGLNQLYALLPGQIAQWSGKVFQESATGIITLLLTFYFLFYLLRDGDRALAVLRQALPLQPDEFNELVGKTSQTVFASVYATAAVAAVQGLLGGLMFWVLGLPAPVFWGVVMGLLAIVPFLGAFVIWVPAAISLALAGEWGSALLLTIWGTVVIGLIDNIIYPILVGTRLSLHPLISFIAIIGGLLLFGAHGIVLGPLLVALMQALLHIARAELPIARTEPLPGKTGP